MDTTKVLNIIVGELALEKLKLEAKLEDTVNSSITISQKVSEVQYLLKELVLNELSLTKFSSMLTQPNNNQENPTQNG